MRKHQDPTISLQLLEQAFSEGLRIQPVSGAGDLHVEIDRTLGAERYTYARLKESKVQQIIFLNGVQPLKSLPCFRLFYWAHADLRGTILEARLVRQVLEQFKMDLRPVYGYEYYIESIVDIDNAVSLAVAAGIFEGPSQDGFDKESGIATKIWQQKVVR
jgi:hypothetical protein